MEASSWVPQANPGRDQTGAHTGQKKITASQRTAQFGRRSTTEKACAGQSGKWQKQPVGQLCDCWIQNLCTKWVLRSMLLRRSGADFFVVGI